MTDRRIDQSFPKLQVTKAETMSLLKTLRFITDHPLNRDKKLNSIIRFVKWQLGSRLVPGEVVFNWVNGSKFFVRSGENGLTQNVYSGLHEFSDMGFLLHFLRKEDLFIDIGANVGSYTILASSAIGARSITFEPIPETYRRLEQNISLNQLDKRVICLNMGLGAEPGAIDFTSDLNAVNHVLAPGEQCNNKITVKVTSLDNALQGEQPILIKIDVEGFEKLVLEGAIETLKNNSLLAVIMELNGSGARYGFDESKLLDLMLSLGFETFAYNPFTRELVSLKGKNQESGNTIFVRNKAIVEERLRTAPKVSVHGKYF